MTAMVKDPVCGMEIAQEKAAMSEPHGEQTFYFCSQGCHETFVSDPHRYAHAVQPDGGHGQHAHH